MSKKLKDRLSRMGRWLAEPAHMLGAGMITLALVIIIVGYINQHAYYKADGKIVEWFKDTPFVTDFYANVSAELASIAITILIVDYLYRLRDERHEDEDLILQAGSPDNAFAREAVRKIEYKGKLRGEKGILRGAVLIRADLIWAHLEGARLLGAKLQGANLQGAIGWTGKQLLSASLEGATMPEGIKYETWIEKRNNQEQAQANDQIQEQEPIEPTTPLNPEDGAFVWRG